MALPARPVNPALNEAACVAIGISPSAVLRLYPFHDGAGTFLTDVSQSAHNAAITGATWQDSGLRFVNPNTYTAVHWADMGAVPAAATSLTVVAVCRLAALDAGGDICGVDDETASPQFDVRLSTVSMRVGTSSMRGASGVTPQDGVDHVLIGTSGTSSTVMRVDGAASTATGTIATRATELSWYMGCHNRNNTARWGGFIGVISMLMIVGGEISADAADALAADPWLLCRSSDSAAIRRRRAHHHAAAMMRRYR